MAALARGEAKPSREALYQAPSVGAFSKQSNGSMTHKRGGWARSPAGRAHGGESVPSWNFGTVRKQIENAEQYFSRSENIGRRVLLLGLVPPVTCLVLLGYAVLELRHSQSEVHTLHEEISKRDQEVEEISEDLRAALIQKHFVRSIDGRDVRAMRRHSPREAEILGRILDMKSEEVSWKPGGATPKEGFDSPNFAGYMLREMNLTMGYLNLSDDESSPNRVLYENLRYVTKPGLGDLVFYPAGFVFFHFQDRRGRPFVIGMTPYGVLALEPGFAEPIGFRNYWFAGRVGGG